ncbi:hypothetical protein ACJJIF_00060 (plasmid) [Microbulbifer sp. SSSA002]|uniref:hypothetical protein n=1 Tax=Microbulbifer sp. SSSA002 TaxID=3243376 RepID=UPI004039939C
MPIPIPNTDTMKDWSYIGFHPLEYSQTDNYQRDKDNASLDLRLLSTESSKLFAGRTSWVLGGLSS